jgi:hypothetical protein
MNQSTLSDWATDGSPALAGSARVLRLAWVGQNNSEELWWATNPPFPDGRNWSDQMQMKIGHTSAGPALLEIDEALMLAWKGMDTDTRLFYNFRPDPEGTTWTSQSVIPGASSDCGPSIAAIGNWIYVAWKEAHSTTIMVSIYNYLGEEWSTPEAVAGVGTSHTPALATYGTNVYMAWKGELDDVGMYWAVHSDGTWTPQQSVPGVGTSHGPSLAVWNDFQDHTSESVYMAWKGEGNDPGIYYSMLKAPSPTSAWLPQAAASGVGTSVGPAIHGWNDGVYAVWKGEGGGTQLWWGQMVAAEGIGVITQS